MRVSARSVAALGAIGLAISNVGRLPGGALGGRNAPLVLADLVVALVWGVLILAVSSRRTRVVVDDVMSAAAAFVAVAAISTALAFSRYSLGISEGAGVLAFLVRWVAYFGWYPFVVWCLTPAESRGACRDIERALLVFALFGIAQSAFLPGFAQMVHDGGGLPTWDIQGRRLVSTILDPNFAGALIVIALLIRLARVAEGFDESVLALVVLGVALILTLSRSSLLALAVGVGAIGVARGFRRRLFGVLAVGALLVLPFLSWLATFAAGFNKLRYDLSAAQRLVPWTRAARLVAEHPVFGVGFNAIKPAQESHGWRLIGGADVSLDGGLFFVAAMTGLVGVSLYLLMVSRVWRGARRVWRDASAPAEDRAHATAAGAATAAIIVHSLFVNSLLLPFVMQVLWVLWGRVAHIRAARRVKLSVGVAALPLAALVAGCDPCAGTVTCSTAPQVTISGTIVDHSTGKAVAGVRVDVAATGTGGFSVSSSALTNADGLWQVNLATPNQQTVQARVTITAPGNASYTVTGVDAPVTTRAGEATVLGLWSDTPFAHYLVTLTRAAAPLVGAHVHFVPTSSSNLTLLQTDAFTNGAGTFQLDFAGQQLTTIVGTLTVTHPSLSRPAVLTGFTIPLDYRFGIPEPRATIPVGGVIAYGGEVIFRGTDEKVGGVGVEFVRTGGIPTIPTQFSTTSNSTGFFRIDLTPGGDGDVIGDLTLRPPGRAPVTYRNVRFATYDSLFIRNSGLWAFGERWSWSVELWRNDSLKPAPGVGAQFIRTGGVALPSDTISGLTSGADGRIELRAPVRDTGFVLGNIVVFPKTGPPRLLTGFRLRTNQDDILHFAGVFSFGASLRYVGEVLTTDGAPVVGAQVTWTQTSGIPASPTVLSSVTDAFGQFNLWLYPSADGGVIGQVVVRPPPPWAAGAQFTFGPLRLDSFLAPDLKLAVTYRIPRP